MQLCRKKNKHNKKKMRSLSLWCLIDILCSVQISKPYLCTLLVRYLVTINDLTRLWNNKFDQAGEFYFIIFFFHKY